jgi:hypothetical protein
MSVLHSRMLVPAGRMVAGLLFVLPTVAGWCVSGAAFGRADGEPPGLAASASAQPNMTMESSTPEAADSTFPVCKLAPGDPPRLAEEPCRPAPPIRPRRSVPQIISRMPAQPSASSPGVDQAYRPLPPAGISPLPSPYLAPGPLPVPGCDKTGCRDAAGVRHNGGIGNATLAPNGRLCQKNGVFLNCS